MDAARIIPQSVELVSVELAEPANDERPELLDHAEYIRCCAEMVACVRDSRREWLRMRRVIECFGNYNLAQTTDSVEAMDAAAPKMMACAVALNARKERV